MGLSLTTLRPHMFNKCGRSDGHRGWQRQRVCCTRGGLQRHGRHASCFMTLTTTTGSWLHRAQRFAWGQWGHAGWHLEQRLCHQKLDGAPGARRLDVRLGAQGPIQLQLQACVWICYGAKHRHLPQPRSSRSKVISTRWTTALRSMEALADTCSATHECPLHAAITHHEQGNVCAM